MPARPGKPSFNLGNLPDPKNFHCEIKTREDSVERDERLRKEFLSFLFKDLSTYVLAILIVLVAIVSCSVVLVRRESTLQEKSWAMGVLSSVFTGAVGFAFGKSASK